MLAIVMAYFMHFGDFAQNVVHVPAAAAHHACAALGGRDDMTTYSGGTGRENSDSGAFVPACRRD